jgi:heme/copper-type cytochrome/quinol oxidase subunit 1
MTTIESSPDAVAIAASDRNADTSSSFNAVAAVFTSTDHKVTGRLYLAGGLLGLVVTVVINVLMSVERIDGADILLDSQILPQLADAQRVGLIFATLLPLAMAGCLAVVPLQLGARSIAFPRLASSGFWMWFGGAILTTVAIANNGGTLGQNANAVGLFIAGIGLMAVGLTASAVSVATTIFTTRAPGMTMRRVPPFSWSALVFTLGLVLVMPVLLGTLAYVFLDHRNGRTGFGGNEGIFTWVGWIITQPVSFLFAIPAVGVLAETVPIVFAKRAAVRGVLFTGIGLIGVAALGGITQQNVQNLPWSGSELNVDDLGTKIGDLVPFLLFNALPILGILLVLLAVLQTARPDDGVRFRFSPAVLFAFFGFGMILVGMLGNLLHAADDLALQGTVFEEATTIYVVYGAVLAAIGAVIHWAPKLWGAKIDSAKVTPLALLGLTGTILAAFPLYIAGFLDQPAGLAYLDDDLVIWNVISLVGHSLMALTVISFLGLLALSLRGDRNVGDDPWDAQTIEWATTSPAPRDNFVDVPVVHSAEPLLDLKPAAASNDRSDA